MPAALALLLLPSCAREEPSLLHGGQGNLVPVTQGVLSISVTEGGTLQSRFPSVIRSTIEGRVAILDIVQEGTVVKKDDVVVVLDSAALQDRLNQQEIEVAKARSDLTVAEEALAIQLMKNQEDEETTRCQRDLAEQALKAYEEGTRTHEINRLGSAILLAKERLVRAQERMEASERLHKQEFITRAELEADRLAAKQAEEEVKISESALEQYSSWLAKSEVMRLRTELRVAEMALERIRAQGKSEKTQKEDVRDTAKKSFDLVTTARDKTASQIRMGTIRSPIDGLVVYAEKDWDEPPIGKGSEVREREEILVIPDLSDMVIEMSIHESSIKKVRPGQKATIRVDAYPDRLLLGTVGYVSVVPTSQSSRWNPDLKVYKTVIRLDQLIDGLKPGMHAQAEIHVEDIHDAIQVPLQAVHQSGPRQFAYVAANGSEAELREVEIGSHNRSAIEIRSGLRPGEQVYLVPPASAPKLPPPPRVEPGVEPVDEGPVEAEASAPAGVQNGDLPAR